MGKIDLREEQSERGWPSFCTALTPTVHPNHSSEVLKVSSYIAFFARFSSGLAFYALFFFAE